MRNASKVVNPERDRQDRAVQAPKRIVVVGRAGSGKTSTAMRLGAEHGLPVVHLDRLAWGPGWRLVDVGQFDALQDELVLGNEWVLDGGYLGSRGWHARLRRADLVVITEAPLPVCLWRIVRRSMRRSPDRRPDLPEGCDEEFSLYFVWWTIGWRWRHRRLHAEIREKRPDVEITRVRT
jgi:adenylate kinase family enzyme